MNTKLTLKALHIHLDNDDVAVDKLYDIQHGGCIDCWANRLDTMFTCSITLHKKIFLLLCPDEGDDQGQALYLPRYPCNLSRGTESQQGHCIYNMLYNMVYYILSYFRSLYFANIIKTTL